MKIKKQYEMKDNAWIHIGDGKLHKGTVIDIFDLEHAGYNKDTEFYIVSIDTEIEPILEVRTWEQMSQDAKGPIGAYRAIKENFPTKRFLGKVGIEVPSEPKEETPDVSTTEIGDGLDVYDPTPEEVNAAIERAEREKNAMYNRIAPANEKPKRFYGKKKSEKRPRRPTV